MAYSIDRPNLQWDAADVAAVKAGIELINDSTHIRFIVAGPNINLDGADMIALDSACDDTHVGFQSPNLNLTTADVVAITAAIA